MRNSSSIFASWSENRTRSFICIAYCNDVATGNKSMIWDTAVRSICSCSSSSLNDTFDCLWHIKVDQGVTALDINCFFCNISCKEYGYSAALEITKYATLLNNRQFSRDSSRCNTQFILFREIVEKVRQRLCHSFHTTKNHNAMISCALHHSCRLQNVRFSFMDTATFTVVLTDMKWDMIGDFVSK